MSLSHIIRRHQTDPIANMTNPTAVVTNCVKIMQVRELLTSTLAKMVKWSGYVLLSIALLKAQVSLQLGKVFSSDNGVSVSIMYSYM